MTTPLRSVIDAVCTRLDTAGVAYWPGPDGSYPKTPPRRPAFAKRLPATPPEALAVATYGLDLQPDPQDPSEVFRVQVRSRAPYDADPPADQALAALHGQHHQVWAGIRVQRCRHLSTAQLGADPSTGLDERTDNYELEVLP